MIDASRFLRRADQGGIRSQKFSLKLGLVKIGSALYNPPLASQMD